MEMIAQALLVTCILSIEWLWSKTQLSKRILSIQVSHLPAPPLLLKPIATVSRRKVSSKTFHQEASSYSQSSTEAELKRLLSHPFNSSSETSLRTSRKRPDSSKSMMELSSWGISCSLIQIGLRPTRRKSWNSISQRKRSLNFRSWESLTFRTQSRWCTQLERQIVQSETSFLASSKQLGFQFSSFPCGRFSK